METKAGGVTVRTVEPLMLPEVAAIVLWPFDTDVANPDALIVATPVLEDPQVTVAVKFCWLLFV